jgi:3-oxoacyl-[acyl-carrier protein] reductase
MEAPATAPAFDTGAVAVVTGGSRGIGRAVAEHLGACGVHVEIAYRAASGEAEATAARIVERGGSAALRKLDVTSEESVRDLFRSVRSERERVDVLVNSAGITRDGYIAVMSRKKFCEVIDTNMVGTFLCSREAAKIMAYRGTGAIVNVASTTFARGNAGQANYAASKGAIISFTRTLALELAGHGVRANAVAPGLIATDMTRRVPAEIAEHVPLGRFGTACEVANLIAFLASRQASYITGATFTVDGGMSA